MTVFDGELIVLWKLSDLIWLLLTEVLIQNFLFLLFWAGRKTLERRMSRRELHGLMKMILWYALLLLPVIAGVVMFRSTYYAIEPPMAVGEEYLNKVSPVIDKVSFSSWTGHGNHWIFKLLFALWISGIFIRGILPCLKEYSLLVKLKRTGAEHKDTKLTGAVQRLERELGIKKPVKVLVNKLVLQPFVTGGFRYRLHFPEMLLEEDERDLLLRHELIHCRHRDSLYRRILFLMCGLYWFNPFMNLFACYFVEVSEMACDDEVLQGRTSQERKIYARLLVSFNQGENFLRHAVALTGHTKSGLERRLENMLKKESKRSKWSAVLITAFMLSVCPLLTVSASYGASVLQEKAVKMVVVEVEEEMNGGNTLTEEVDFIKIEDMVDLGLNLGARGVTAVDTTLNGIGAASVATVKLEKGSKVYFIIVGDNSTDAFRVGYEDSAHKNTSVSTTNGEIVHTFTIPKTDTYTLFIQGTTTKTIHVEGSVTTR